MRQTLNTPRLHRLKCLLMHQIPDLPEQALDFVFSFMGMTKHSDLFTARQLVALTTRISWPKPVTRSARTPSPSVSMTTHRCARVVTALAYAAEAVSVYLAFAVDRSADRSSTICSWDSSPKMEALRNTFARQAIPMVWDFAEGNPFSSSSGNWLNNVDWTAKTIELLPAHKLVQCCSVMQLRSVYPRT
ncbi:MAG: hypothetical protein R2873_27435 [Caldilineaceae bacterium]